MQEPVVSVLIPTYNRAELLRAALDSVFRQTFSDLRVVVVDDGSTDHTPEVVQGFKSPRLVYVRLDRCANLSVLRNAGIRRCSGPLVAFLDSDDLWREDKLAIQLELLKRHRIAGFVVSGYEVFDTAGVQRTKLYGELAGVSIQSIFDDLIRGRITLCSSSMLIRRTLIYRTGLLNETLPSGDYEFYTRLAWHGQAGIVHEPLVKVRRHEGNSSLQWDAEGLDEAIFAVRRIYSLGLIGRDLRDERLTKYRTELEDILLRRRDTAGLQRLRAEHPEQA